MDYQVCSRCIMDTTVPRITFNSEGVCNFCIFHDQLEEEHPQGEVGKAYLNKIYTLTRNNGNIGRDRLTVTGGSMTQSMLYGLKSGIDQRDYCNRLSTYCKR